MQEKTKIINNNYLNTHLVNEQINYPSVRVIDKAGKQLGIFSSKTALQLADREGLDLIVVSKKSNPPVCKILNYSKHKFAQEKKARKAKKKQQNVSLKEVKMRYKIEQHDYNVRLNQARRFLQSGNKVKATVTFRGREIQHLNLAISLLNKMANDLQKTAEVQQKPYRDGKSLIMFLTTKKSLL
uniref:Translation initiation factor IF-3 n=1 Tax=Hildenbrandia rivularis TaxID=135206 RepID=A0A1C9CFL5_9FLOR|nr:translation initiation factor 3 [Hildenbrandia rivularis]AOM67147.1 translation initiation factor 3 [Hildenbrandia rivularis]